MAADSQAPLVFIKGINVASGVEVATTWSDSSVTSTSFYNFTTAAATDSLWITDLGSSTPGCANVLLNKEASTTGYAVSSEGNHTFSLSTDMPADFEVRDSCAGSPISSINIPDGQTAAVISLVYTGTDEGGLATLTADNGSGISNSQSIYSLDVGNSSSTYSPIPYAAAASYAVLVAENYFFGPPDEYLPLPQHRDGCLTFYLIIYDEFGYITPIPAASTVDIAIDSGLTFHTDGTCSAPATSNITVSFGASQDVAGPYSIDLGSPGTAATLSVGTATGEISEIFQGSISLNPL